MKISKSLTQSILFFFVLAMANVSFAQLPNLKNAKKLGKKIKTTEKKTEQKKNEVKSATLSDCSKRFQNQFRMFDLKLEDVAQSQSENGAPNYIENEIIKLTMMKEDLDNLSKQCEADNTMDSGLKKQYESSLVKFDNVQKGKNESDAISLNYESGMRKIEQLKQYWYQFPTSRIKSVGDYQNPLPKKEELDFYHAASLDEDDTYIRNAKEGLVKIEEKINEEQCDKNIKRTFQEWNNLATNNAVDEAKERFETFISDMDYYQTNVLPENTKLKEWSELARGYLKTL